MSRMDGWTHLHSYSNVLEAQMAQGVLESADIEAMLLDVETVSQDWLLSNAIGGVKLYVRDTQKDAAETLLADLKAASAELKCPLCDSSDVKEREDSTPWTITKVLVVLLTGGFALFFKGYRYTCKSCGRRWG